jgi:N,N'-diacetyllegionaminate synthase
MTKNQVFGSQKVYIIAEAGVNHNGRLDLAKKLVDVAVEAGADAIKFQTFKARNLVSKNAPKAEYQKQGTENNESQFQMLQKLELDLNAHKELLEYCEQKGIQFLSTPFDQESVDLLIKLGMPLFKIPSGEITNLPHLRYIGSLKKPIILSTGMSTLGEIEDALKVLTDSGTSFKNITVLHCNTEYPTPMKNVNLKAMQTIQSAFPGISVGYSDHTLGIEVPIAAVALGAQVIEKHFTLSKDLKGPDHQVSLEPLELKAMVKAIRNIERALGGARKCPNQKEIKNRLIGRKSIVASTSILKGEVLSDKNLTTKRPGNGIDPMRWDDIIGKTASHDYQVDDLIEI